MSNHIIAMLKKRIEELDMYDTLDAETRRNVLKEELQFYVLDFIYHHPEYHRWIMYGGSALRILHGLNRMSVDLDFEVSRAVTNDFLQTLKNEIETHFSQTYGTDTDFLTAKVVGGRGLKLKFHIGEMLGIDHPSKQVHVKIDLNRFVAPKTVTERIPVSRNQLSFVILTYNMSALMASKIAAIVLRGARIVGKNVYEEKGRDIYDLLWYMEKKIVPDFDYLVAKEIDIRNLRALFDTLTLRMNTVSTENLKQDLTPLFEHKTFIDNWMTHWLEQYFHLLEEYHIRTVTDVKRIGVYRDFSSDNFYFTYTYDTEEKDPIRVIYAMSDYWIDFAPHALPNDVDEKIASLIGFGGNGMTSHPSSEEMIKKYTTLFFKKTEEYFKKTHNVVVGDMLETKLIRMTADNLNRNTEIVLTMPTLLSCELDDLLK